MPREPAYRVPLYPEGKKRLHKAGVDLQLMRFLCRDIVNLRCPLAEQRFWQAYHNDAQSSPFWLPCYLT